MPLRQAPVTVPEFPTRLAWAAALVGLLAVVLGLLGVGSSSPTPVLGPDRSPWRAMTRPRADECPSISTNPSRSASGNFPPAAEHPTTAQLVLSLGGVSVVRSTPVPLVHGPTGLLHDGGRQRRSLRRGRKADGRPEALGPAGAR